MRHDDDYIECFDNGPIRTIHLNRPQARNAITYDMSVRISNLLQELDHNPLLRVGVLCGTDDVFSAGMDLKEFAEGREPWLPGRGFAGFTEAPPRKPLIAAVEGPAVAGGFEMALACDLVVAGSSSTFWLPEVSLGLVPGGGGMIRLSQQLPLSLALEIVLLGQSIAAPRMLEVGLLNALVPDGRAADTAQQMAKLIASHSPTAVLVSKRVVSASRKMTESAAFARQRPLMEQVLSSEDASEGVAAFRERRAPQWSAPISEEDLEAWYP